MSNTEHLFHSDVVHAIVDLMKDQRDSYECQNLDVCEAHRRETEALKDSIRHLRTQHSPWIAATVVSWTVTVATMGGVIYHLMP